MKWEIVVRPERSQPRATRGKQARVPNNVLKMVTAAYSIKQTGERSQKTRKEPKCKRKLMTSHNWVWAFSSLCHINKERHLKYAERLVLGLELRTTALTVPL